MNHNEIAILNMAPSFCESRCPKWIAYRASSHCVIYTCAAGRYSLETLVNTGVRKVKQKERRKKKKERRKKEQKIYILEREEKDRRKR
jgi:hypothetical protein